MNPGDFDYMILADSPAAQEELVSIVNESDGGDSVIHDDSSSCLDDYNELTLGDISNQIPDDAEPSIIVSMLLEEVSHVTLNFTILICFIRRHLLLAP
jgi:hypothetical protein